MEKNITKHVREICNAIGNGFEGDKEKRNCALSAFEATINSMGDYVNAVLYMETGLQVARFRLEGQEFRDRVMELDRRGVLRLSTAFAVWSAAPYFMRATSRTVMLLPTTQALWFRLCSQAASRKMDP